jgi:hypothetical protein
MPLSSARIIIMMILEVALFFMLLAQIHDCRYINKQLKANDNETKAELNPISHTAP